MSISQNQLLRFNLMRQGLLERQPLSELPNFGPLLIADHTTPYLSLLERVEDFVWENLADQLYEFRAYTRLPAMRGLPYLIPTQQVEMIECLFALSEEDPFPPFEEFNISLEEAFELRFFITEVLQQEGAQSPNSIKDYLSPDLIFMHQNKSGQQTTSIRPVMQWMWRLRLTQMGSGINDWRQKDDKFYLSEMLPPECQTKEHKLPAAIDLARWYFELYAPAALDDWLWWCGIEESLAQEAFETLRDDELAKIQVLDMAEELWIPHALLGELESAPDASPEMVRLLPQRDALMNAYHSTLYRFYDEEGLAGEIAYNSQGEAFPTVWVDGHIIGIWSWNRKKNEPMTVEPFFQMTKALRKRIKPEVDLVQDFVNASHVLWTQ